MHHIILFDTDIRESLLPFTYTRPVCDIRVGVLTIEEKWRQLVPNIAVSYITPEHLEPLYPIDINEDNYLINGAILPTRQILAQIQDLESGETIMMGDELIAARLSKSKFEKLLVKNDLDRLKGFQIDQSKVQL
ncbi:MAG: glucose-1-phosphate thymidylyltransferase, partial [Saprospiraceae bacterium]|nr:glucose-1-phosphate thymidylyltransferase [Saprospiraceae bacterium]